MRKQINQLQAQKRRAVRAPNKARQEEQSKATKNAHSKGLMGESKNNTETARDSTETTRRSGKLKRGRVWDANRQ